MGNRLVLGRRQYGRCGRAEGKLEQGVRTAYVSFALFFLCSASRDGRLRAARTPSDLSDELTLLAFFSLPTASLKSTRVSQKDLTTLFASFRVRSVSFVRLENESRVDPSFRPSSLRLSRPSHYHHHHHHHRHRPHYHYHSPCHLLIIFPFFDIFRRLPPAELAPIPPARQ